MPLLPPLPPLPLLPRWSECCSSSLMSNSLFGLPALPCCFHAPPIPTPPPIPILGCSLPEAPCL